MAILHEALLTKQQVIEKIKSGYDGETSPLMSCYNWVGVILANNPGKLDNAVVALYGLPGTNKIAHAAIEHPNGKLIFEKREPKGFRNSEGFVDRPDYERQTIPVPSIMKKLSESIDKRFDMIFGYRDPTVVSTLCESDRRIDELFSGNGGYEFAFDQGEDYCDYQFIVPGPTGDDDPERYVIDCRFRDISAEDNIWSVEFTDKNGHRASSKNNGKQFPILNTILSIVEDFVHRNPGSTLEFSGEIGQGSALQGQVYSAMLRRLSGKLKSMGYRSSERDYKGDRKFVVGPIKEDTISELMGDSGVLPYTDHGNSCTFEANGRVYRVYEVYNEFFFEVGEESSTEPTGLNNGTQFKIINTAFAIMKSIVEKKSDVTSWSFSGAIEENDGRVSGLGRMYHMICRKDFTPWMVNRGFVGYHDLTSEDSYDFIYTLLEEFQEILHNDPSDLSHLDVNQLYGFNREEFKSLQQTG